MKTYMQGISLGTLAGAAGAAIATGGTGAVEAEGVRNEWKV